MLADKNKTEIRRTENNQRKVSQLLIGITWTYTRIEGYPEYGIWSRRAASNQHHRSELHHQSSNQLHRKIHYQQIMNKSVLSRKNFNHSKKKTINFSMSKLTMLASSNFCSSKLHFGDPNINSKSEKSLNSKDFWWFTKLLELKFSRIDFSLQDVTFRQQNRICGLNRSKIFSFFSSSLRKCNDKPIRIA